MAKKIFLVGRVFVSKEVLSEFNLKNDKPIDGADNTFFITDLKQLEALYLDIANDFIQPVEAMPPKKEQMPFELKHECAESYRNLPEKFFYLKEHKSLFQDFSVLGDFATKTINKFYTQKIYNLADVIVKWSRQDFNRMISSRPFNFGQNTKRKIRDLIKQYVDDKDIYWRSVNSYED